MNYDIQVNNVSKTYDSVSILDNVNLMIEKGTTVGIVGGNGSGKSVLFKVICGFTAPDTGTVDIRDKRLGRDIDFPEDVGVFINSPGYISLYNGLQNLKFLADINGKIGINKIKETMKIVGLNPDNKAKVKDYSLGMKQKLGIAQAIMEDQDIVVLDEPFNALDYKTYNDIKEIIKHLQEQDHTMVLTSHNYQDIEELCDIVYLIDEGRLKPLTDKLKEEYFSR
ncbi:multidrug ABC transporter ATP-binding protein [Bacillus sp. J14TS2]|uniref:ABC transporter ATP-binding protein n=1 Tax=Bacillus sp. J14TS2 TaxID=2807188 RepID=UPI001B10A2FF|nr:ABC transporter ATP-binding protein [Bacillus sp. J14TS2]GIN74082.1 multidrug ABC transporter ATP-binding protein [Bacillus sp. J14TS2]